MQLISVNIGQAQELVTAKRTTTTAIFKKAAAGPTRVTALGLVGDEVCDVKHHGGPDQAVYLYTEPDYLWWSAELGQPLPPGTFGENLTIAGLESAACWVGDRLRMGEVVLEVTAPRIPCGTLAARMGDPAFVKRFRAAERPGVYCRVLNEGMVSAGDAVIYEPAEARTLSILQMYRDYFTADLDEESILRHLAAPIDIRTRKEMEALLEKKRGAAKE